MLTNAPLPFLAQPGKTTYLKLSDSPLRIYLPGGATSGQKHCLGKALLFPLGRNHAQPQFQSYTAFPTPRWVPTTCPCG
eukprot:1114768-Pelagomonas_calceolata.AAC.1